MKAVLKLEIIADDFFWAKNKNKNIEFHTWLQKMKQLGPDKSQTWVALKNNSGLNFIQPTRDYSNANRNGSRGIFGYYLLTDGIYEINHRYKLNRVRRYFIHVTGESYAEISKEEAECLIKNFSE